MKPPDQVPEGLTEIEYQRLVALYTLMGRHSHATKALAFLAELRSPKEVTVSEEAKATQAGAEFASALMQLLKKINAETESSESEAARASADTERLNAEMKAATPGLHFASSLKGEDRDAEDEEASDCDDDEDPVESMKQQLISIGLSEEEAQEYLEKLKKALSEMTKPEPPPREVPEDLSAADYWELALKYKQVGWTEQARDALNMAIELDGDGDVGKRARCFLRSKIPRHPVPLMAEQLNIQGYNQMFNNEEEARVTFENLVRTYPDFEWPYGNLGSLLIKCGELPTAEDVLQKAVIINPYYINAWLHLSRVYAIESRFKEADECLERVLAIDPLDPNWRGIKDIVEQLKNDKFN